MTRGIRRELRTVRAVQPLPTTQTSLVAVHPFEDDRLRSLRAYRVIDSEPEPAFQSLVRAAASLLGTTGAALNLVDGRRQWSKASCGPGLREIPREWSMCSDVVATESPLVVDDVCEHARYRLNPLTYAPHTLRAYLGVPLIGRDGLPLGALSVTNAQPRHFTTADVTTLTGLAQAAVALMGARRSELDEGQARRFGASSAQGLNLPQVVTDRFSAAGVRRALQAGEFEVFYQPIVCLTNGRPVGVEALARWNVPGVGLLTPDRFLHHVENSPLLSQAFTNFVLNAACGQLARWRELGASDLRVSVNISGSDVTGGELLPMVAGALQRAQLPATALTLEITETVGLDDRDAAVSSLSRVRGLGVRVSLDDFGVGYSTLEHAGVLPITGLKLDRRLVAGVAGSPTFKVLQDSVISLCRTLELGLVAEGVETRETADELLAAGVRYAQGYFFARPMPAAELSRLIQTDTGTALPVLPLPVAPAVRLADSA